MNVSEPANAPDCSRDNHDWHVIEKAENGRSFTKQCHACGVTWKYFEVFHAKTHMFVFVFVPGCGVVHTWNFEEHAWQSSNPLMVPNRGHREHLGVEGTWNSSPGAFP